MAQLEQISKPTLADWRQRWRQLKKVGTEYKGPCPNRHCPGGPGKDRFWVKKDGSFGCRHCEPGKDNPDAYKAILKGAGLFKVNPKPNGHAKVNGHAAPTQYAVIKAPKPPPGYKIPEGYHWVSTHGYDTVDGQRLYAVRCEDGKGNKDIRRNRADIKSKLFPLGHHQLDLSKPVVITEGEKDRDAVIAHTNGEYQCTTWQGGTNAWDKTNWERLAGSEVILWPDRDMPGHKAMEGLADHLLELDCRVMAVDHPMGEQDGWGAADATPEQAQELLADAYSPYEGDPGTMLPESDCYPDWQPIPGMMECGAAANWHGPPKAGKSAFTLLAAAQLLSGENLIGIPNQAAPKPEDRRDHKLLMIWLEESKQTATMRRWALYHQHNVSPDIWDNSNWFYKNQLAATSKDRKDRLKDLKASIHHNRPTVVFIDNLARFDPKAETDPAAATELVTNLEQIAETCNCAIVLIHHDRKMPGQDGGIASGDEMSRGSSALIAAVRVMVQVKSEGRDFVRVVGGGTNNAESAGQLKFKKNSVRVNGFSTVALSAVEEPDLFEGMGNPDKMQDALEALFNEPPEQRRKDTQGEGWAGNFLASWYDMDAGPGRTSKERTKDQTAIFERMKKILQTWMQNDVLTTEKADIKYNKSTTKKDVYCRGPGSLRTPQ